MSSPHRLRASLALNLVLAASALVLALRPADSPAPLAPSAGPASPGPATTATAATAASAPSPAGGYAADASSAERRRWLVDRLRERGMPNPVLARFVLADIEAHWNPRAAELAIRTHGDPDTMAALQLEIDASRDADMRAALGDQGFLQWDRDNMLREANQGRIDLAPAEVAAGYEIWKTMQRRELELRAAKLGAELDDADAALEYGKALARFQTEMIALLGEERYALSRELDHDPAARLGDELGTLVTDNAQIRALLETQKQWNDIRLELEKEFEADPTSPTYAEQLRVLDEARDHEYRQVLGAEAFDALQKERHPGYAMMKKHAELWGLDEGKIESVYGSLKYYEKAVRDYRAELGQLEESGRAVSQAAAREELRQFADRTRQLLAGYLGEEKFARMERSGVFQLDGPGLPSGATIQPMDRNGG